MNKREEFIAAMEAKGKSREWTEAFLDVLGSALTKRGLPSGRVLTDEETAERVRVMLDGSEAGR